MDEKTVHISVVAGQFDVREDLMTVMIREFSEKNNIIVAVPDDSTGSAVVLESFYRGLLRSAKFIKGFICPPERVSASLMVEGREYNQSYIYFLLDSGCIVYVGQTVNLRDRLKGHRQNKHFDSVAVAQVHKSFLDVAEQVNIIHYNPVLNGTMWSPKAMFKRILENCEY